MISIIGRLLWMWYHRTKRLFILVSLFAHAIVRAYRVLVFMKKNITSRSKGRQNGLTCLLLLLLLLQTSCSNCPIAHAHAHADLELWWSCVFLDAVPYFISGINTIKTRRPWSDCADVHSCTCESRTLLISCFLGALNILFIYLFYLFIYLFIYLFANILTGPYFT